MAKKKTAHQDKPTQNGEKLHQSSPAMEDASEKIESLKSLNSMLVRETVERRQQVESLQQSNGSLEMELKSFQMEKNELESDLGNIAECNLRGEIERDLVLVFVGVQVGEKFSVFEREIYDFEKKLGDLEREIVRVMKERSEIEEVKRERDVEIGVLKKELSDVLREIESEKVVSSRMVCERDEMRSVLAGKIEESRVVNLKIVEVEDRDRVVRDEVEELRSKCDRLVEEKEEKERRVEVVLREKGMVERSLVESNKVIEGLKKKIVEMGREEEAVVVERDLQVVKVNELENDVFRLNDLVLSLRKEEEKLQGNIHDLKKKCGEGEAKVKELGMEINKLVESLERLTDEKGLILKQLDEALKQYDELKSRAEEGLEAKRVLEGAKVKQEGEILELKMQEANLKDTIQSLEEASRAEKEKLKGLVSEVGRYRDEVGRIINERDDARKGLKQEKSCTKELRGKIIDKEKSIEESNKVMEKIKNQKSSLTEQKKDLENRHSALKNVLTLAQKKLDETQKELDSMQAKVGLADANSEIILKLLRNTVTLVSMTKEKNVIANQMKARDGVKAYVAELDRIKDAFKSRESAVEDMKRKLESMQHSEAAAHKKSFWTLFTSATIFVVASVAYVAKH